MKIKLLFCLAIPYFLISCSSGKKAITNDYFVKEVDYIKAYKAFVFYGCFNEGTKGDFFEFLKKNNDLGLFTETELIFHTSANFADSLGRIYSHKIEPFDYGDGKGKTPNLSACLNYAFSNEIDSIAKIKYRKLLKSK